MMSFRGFRAPLILALAVPMLAVGCIWSDDFGDFEFSEVLVCAEAQLSPGVEVTSSTLGGEDTYAGSCGGSGSPDLVYQFTAPADDYYRFTTAGSGFDTVLYLHSEQCDGEELACDDDAGALQTSEVIRPMVAGERVMVVADGKSDEGALSLLAENVHCPSIQLVDSNLPIDHTLVGQSDDHSGGSCGGDGFGDRAYRFRAPDEGLYRFELTTDTAAFVGALYLEEGPICGGRALGCNSGAPRISHVTRRLRAGEDVTVRVDGDGSEGGYALDVHRLAATSCIDAIVDGSVYSLPEDAPHRMTTSCGDTAYWGTGASDPADITEFPDLNLRVENPGPSLFCALGIRARFAFTAAVLEADECVGAELDCEVGVHDASSANDTPYYDATIGLPSGDWTSVTLVVDRTLELHPMLPQYDGPEFELTWYCAIP